MHTYGKVWEGWRMNGMCGMGTTTTTAGVDGAWTARTFVMLDCAEIQKQQQESGETKLAKRYIDVHTDIHTVRSR